MTLQAWWAEPGPDECEFCSRSFYLEVGYYCAICDRPVCPACVITVFEGQLVSCPDCRSGGS